MAVNEHLSDDVVDEVVDGVLAVLQVMHSVATPALCQMDVSMSQVKTMLTVSLSGQATVGSIARMMGTGLPAASATVDRLVNMGWLTRAEDPEDRRRTIVRLTPEGQEQIETVWRLRRAMLRDSIRRMAPADVRLLSQGIAALRAVTGDAVAQPEAAAEAVSASSAAVSAIVPPRA